MEQDLRRIEAKVDLLTEAIQTLIRVEERQNTHGVRIGALEDRATAQAVETRAVDKKVDQWINRGIGIWALVLCLWSIYLATR
jgi:hypothetical protein